MVKINNKLSNFAAAAKRLREAVTAYKNDKGNDLYRDALIQRFEFTYELAWKTASEIIREQGVATPMHSPKSVFKAAYEIGFIHNEQVWVDILDDRNFMSHIYDMDLSVRIADDICNRYAKALSDLLNELKTAV